MPQVINTNVASMFAQAKLGAAQKDANVALERLSTGLRINSAKDDAAYRLWKKSPRNYGERLGKLEIPEIRALPRNDRGLFSGGDRLLFCYQSFRGLFSGGESRLHALGTCAPGN